MSKHTQSAALPARGSFASRLLHGGFAALSLILVLTASQAQAGGTAAGSVISNQASAQYTDNGGNPQTSNSNTVQTTVVAVGSFTLNSDNTKIAAAGTTVYMSHTLTNTGNSEDEFKLSLPTGTIDSNLASIQIFADNNADGQPDSTTPICTVNSAGSPCTNVLTGVIQPDGQYNFIVAMTVLSSATDLAVVTPEVVTAIPRGVIVPLASYPDYDSTAGTAPNNVQHAQHNTDSVTVQNKIAVINFTKTVMGFGSTNSSFSNVFNGTDPAQGPATYTDAAGTTHNEYVTYRLSYTNSGNATGPVYITDTIGSGSTVGYSYVPNSGKWSNPGVGVTSLDDTNAVPTAGIAYTATGGVITATIYNVAANSSGYIEFNVKVESTAALGTTTTNNSATYGTPTGCTGTPVTACTTAPSSTVATNNAPFDVTGVYSLIANKDTSTNDGNNVTPTGQDLVISVADKAQAGDTVVFTDYIHNTGNSTDTYNISLGDVTSGLTAFPTGTVFQVYKSDASSPLLDTNGDTTIDTGPVAAGAYYAVVIKAILPSNASAGGPFTESLTATSVAVPAQSNVVFNQLSSIVNASLALVSNSANQIYPGGTVVYPHNLINNGNSSCTTTNFVVTNSQAAANWQYTLYVDTDKNGQLDTNIDTLIGGGIAGSTVTGAVTVTASGTATAQRSLLVKVTSPSGAQANDIDIITIVANADCTVTTGVTTPASTVAVNDTTTVVLGQLRVVKSQAIVAADASGVCSTTQPADNLYVLSDQTAKPKDCIWYRIVATNQGLAAVTAVKLTDQIPSFTAYQMGHICTESGTAPTTSIKATGSAAGSAMVCGTWDTVAPNATVQMDFAVKVQ